MSLPSEITGRETLAGDRSALDALIDFCWAFNGSDLEALGTNWADGDGCQPSSMIGGPMI
jgi:hypothetical protein